MVDFEIEFAVAVVVVVVVDVVVVVVVVASAEPAVVAVVADGPFLLCVSPYLFPFYLWQLLVQLFGHSNETFCWGNVTPVMSRWWKAMT